MDIIYIVIFICALISEFSAHINSAGVFKQISLMLIAVGALVALYGNQTDLLLVGFSICSVQNVYFAFRKKRRAGDSLRGVKQ